MFILCPDALSLNGSIMITITITTNTQMWFGFADITLPFLLRKCVGNWISSDHNAFFFLNMHTDNFRIFKYTRASLINFLNVDTQSFCLFKYTHQCDLALMIKCDTDKSNTTWCIYYDWSISIGVILSNQKSVCYWACSTMCRVRLTE